MGGQTQGDGPIRLRHLQAGLIPHRQRTPPLKQNSLYQQEILIVSLSKQVSVYIKEAPFVIAALYKKIQQELAVGKGEAGAGVGVGSRPAQPKLSVRRYKYLQALFFIMSLGS